MVKLENWRIYEIPTLSGMVGVLGGRAYGHPKFEDGEEIMTSFIMDLNIPNKRAKTYSGSEYILGSPDPKWLEWLEENNFTEDLEDLKAYEKNLMN
jgi:hypothetical protein